MPVCEVCGAETEDLKQHAQDVGDEAHKRTIEAMDGEATEEETL